MQEEEINVYKQLIEDLKKAVLDERRKRYEDEIRIREEVSEEFAKYVAKSDRHNA